MTDAVRATAAQLRDALPTIEKHRPSVAAAALVARELADRYRTDRGCVNESVEQIARSTGLSNGQVRDALGALHQLGWWVVDGKGNHLRPTIRRPGPVLLDALEHRGTTRDADPRASRDHPRCGPESIAGPPAMLDNESGPASRDTPAASRDQHPSIAGPPATPHPHISPDDSSLTTGSSARGDQPAEIDQRPPPPAEPDPEPTPGSLVWLNWLARRVGDDCPLTLTQRRTALTHAHHDHPDLDGQALIAELRARHPAAGPAPPPRRLAAHAQAALDHLDAHEPAPA